VWETMARTKPNHKIFFSDKVSEKRFLVELMLNQKWRQIMLDAIHDEASRNAHREQLAQSWKERHA